MTAPRVPSYLNHAPKPLLIFNLYFITLIHMLALTTLVLVLIASSTVAAPVATKDLASTSVYMKRGLVPKAVTNVFTKAITNVEKLGAKATNLDIFKAYFHAVMTGDERAAMALRVLRSPEGKTGPDSWIKRHIRWIYDTFGPKGYYSKDVKFLQRGEEIGEKVIWAGATVTSVLFGLWVIEGLIESHKQPGGKFTDEEMAMLVQTAKEHPDQYPAMLKKLQDMESVSNHQIDRFIKEAKPTEGVAGSTDVTTGGVATKRSLVELD
ncbi:hypothetical protein FRB95_005750 [Tulasnella sp. JGI-2019a]|nr:hypothetical protein FRB95_005750 [Tulasnella sp. JGI-2019a]